MSHLEILFRTERSSSPFLCILQVVNLLHNCHLLAAETSLIRIEGYSILIVSDGT